MSEASEIISGRMTPTDRVVKQLRSYTPLFSQFAPGVVQGYSQDNRKGDMDFYPFEIIGPEPRAVEAMRPLEPGDFVYYDKDVQALPALLPTNSQARKRIPMCTGLLDYFPAALAEVAKVSHVANEQHNPGQRMFWAREKSVDHQDCIVRHLAERSETDTDGLRHSAKLAWRALALLQQELEDAGAKPGRASRWPEKGGAG